MSYCDLCKFDDCYFCLICSYSGCECKCPDRWKGWKGLRDEKGNPIFKVWGDGIKEMKEGK